MPIESLGQAATHVPHWMHRPASMTPAANSQNQVLPGASVIPFIRRRMSNVALTRPPPRSAHRARPGSRRPSGPLVEPFAGAALGTEPADHAGQRLGDVVHRAGTVHPVDEGGVGPQAPPH